MRIGCTIDGDLEEIMAEEIRAGQAAVSGAMRSAGIALKTAWRQQVLAAGLGTRLANAARSETYPKDKDSLNAATLVWTKAPKIYGVMNRGAVIHARSGIWLAIPMPTAGRDASGVRLTPAEWERRNGRRLQFIPVKGGRSALLVDKGARHLGGAMTRKGARGGSHARSKASAAEDRSVVMFTLVREVTLRKKLNLWQPVESVASGIPAEIIARWRTTR